MGSSSRFVVALHILAGLAIVNKLKKEECITSERIAWSVNTNPVVVRRILGRLRRAGLVTSQIGVDGGSKLARDAQTITLGDILHAVEDRSLFRFHFNSPNKDCPVGANIRPAVEDVLDRAEAAMKEELERITLDQIAKNIMILSGRTFEIAEAY